MEQLQPAAEMKIVIDYTNPAWPAAFQLFKPVVFLDGKTYCCVLGKDIQSGIYGCAGTIEEAIRDWDLALRRSEKSVNHTGELEQLIHQKLQDAELLPYD